jgi:hypothetical protein
MMRSYDASQQGLFRTFAPADGDTAIGDIFGGRQDIRTGGRAVSTSSSSVGAPWARP